MSNIDVQKLNNLVNSGHQLDPTTIRTLLATIEDYQKHPRTAGPGITPPKLRPAKDQVQAMSQYLMENGEWLTNNPVLDYIRQAAEDLSQLGIRERLTYKPTSIQLEIHPEPMGTRVRLLALATQKEQQPAQPRCGNSGGYGSPRGHECTCIRRAGHTHPTDHGCHCGATWKDTP